MKISLMVEGQAGVTWARWRELASRIDDWGFAGLFRSDHFTMRQETREDALEMIVSLAYLADHTRRIHFGPLVAPVSFREPVMLARQAAHIDDLSDGRMILGVGAGWQVREHEMFGYPLLDTKARMQRFTEGLHLIWLLLKSDGPVSFEGRWYNLKDAQLLPRDHKTKILVGGNGVTKTLALAARYADVWNGVQLSPERFQELASTLDRYLYEAGRESNAIQKTTATFLHFGKDEAALEQRLARLRRDREMTDLKLDEVVKSVRERDNAVIGIGDEVVPQIRAYSDAGVDELMLQILDSDDIDGIETFARTILPRFAGA